MSENREQICRVLTEEILGNNNTVSDGICECGCGQTTSISPKNYKRDGIMKGDHRRFCHGHQNRRFIKNHNIEPKRGQFIHSGYVYVLAPAEHPRPTNKRYIKRCRLVMEKKLGRYLDHTEQVHHIDMNRMNDDPDNLCVMSLSDHNKLHHKAGKMAKVAIQSRQSL